MFAFLRSAKSDPFGQHVEELNDFETCIDWKPFKIEVFKQKRQRRRRGFLGKIDVFQQDESISLNI